MKVRDQLAHVVFKGAIVAIIEFILKFIMILIKNDSVNLMISCTKSDRRRVYRR